MFLCFHMSSIILFYTAWIVTYFTDICIRIFSVIGVVINNNDKFFINLFAKIIKNYQHNFKMILLVFKILPSKMTFLPTFTSRFSFWDIFKNVRFWHLLTFKTPFSQHITSNVFQIIHISVETVWTIIFFFTFILFFSCFW